MVGLRQVNQLKVESECACQQHGAFHRKRVDQRQRASPLTVRLFVLAVGLRVAPPDRALPQRFHVDKQLFAGLLAQHLAEQHPQRTHIAPQRSFFQVAGLRFQLRQPLRPTLGIPQ